jgi:hypothetical protein
LKIKLPESSEVRRHLQTKQQVIKEYFGGPLYSSCDGCGDWKFCFYAKEKITEFDALIVGDGQKTRFVYRVMTYKQRNGLTLLFVLPTI